MRVVLFFKPDVFVKRTVWFDGELMRNCQLGLGANAVDDLIYISWNTCRITMNDTWNLIYFSSPRYMWKERHDLMRNCPPGLGAAHKIHSYYDFWTTEHQWVYIPSLYTITLRCYSNFDGIWASCQQFCVVFPHPSFRCSGILEIECYHKL